MNVDSCYRAKEVIKKKEKAKDYIDFISLLIEMGLGEGSDSKDLFSK